jgi:hypothetical protein
MKSKFTRVAAAVIAILLVVIMLLGLFVPYL